MKVTPLALPGVLLIEPIVHGDERGFLMESWNLRRFAAAGLDAIFVQDNHIRSSRGVLRGLHFQLPQPQGKLVRVVSGAVYDVAVDLRRSSPAFGKWAGVELSETNRRMLWVPVGMAHGLLTLSETADCVYKCTDYYAPEHEHTLAWDDPQVGIEWPVEDLTPKVSAKDAAARRLSELECFA